MSKPFAARNDADSGYARFSRPFNRRRLLAMIFGAALPFYAPGLAADEAGPRVLAFGDSLTAGYGSGPGEGFVPQLEAWLRANGLPEASVQNGGLSGDTTSGGRARLGWALAGGTYDVALLELGANDALRGIEPRYTRENLAAMLEEFRAADLPVMLAGMYAPRNWGEDYVAEFEAIYPELAEEYGATLYPFFLEGVAGDRTLNQQDGIHPNAEGNAILAEKLGAALKAMLAEDPTG